MPAVMRACSVIEQTGVPAVAVGSAHFEEMGHLVGDAIGIPHVPIVVYPGVPLSDTSEQFERKMNRRAAPGVTSC